MKSKSHIYMANLLREHILLKSGRISVDGRFFIVPKDFMYALMNYPQEYRAGAIGPDFFPDMLFGQTQMHPQNSGVWLKRMRLVLSRYQKSSPEYYPALAFYLGYLTHYATDLFGHEDVNYYAGGFFPSISDLIVKLIKVGENKKGQEDLSIIVRHMMVETYMDNKVPLDEPMDIEVPLDFIKKCFGTLEAYLFMKENGCAETSLKSFNVLPQMIRNYYVAVYNSNTIRGIEKREEYIDSWLNLWVTIAKLDIKNDLGVAYEETKESLVHLMTNYALSFADLEGAGDAIQTIMNIFGLASQAIADVLTLGLNRLFSSVSNRIGELIKERIVGNCLAGVVLSLGGTSADIKNFKAEKEFIKKLVENPKIILNQDKFCKAHNAKAREHFKKRENFYLFCREKNIYKESKAFFSDYLDYKWGNYGKERDIEKQDYKEFKRCLKMGLLCMLSANDLNRIILRTTREVQHTFTGINNQLGTYSLVVTCTMRSNASADTINDVYLEIDDGTNDSYRFLLDHGGIDDFEEGGLYTYNIHLPEFIPYSKIKGMRIVKFGRDDADFDTVYVSDMSTGRLIARTNAFSLTDNIRYRELTICDKLNVKDTSDFEHIAGIYVVFWGPDNIYSKDLTLTLSTKSGWEKSWTYSFKRINEGSDIRFFPLFARYDDIKKIEYKYSSRKDLSYVYLFEGQSFRNIGYETKLNRDGKPHQISFFKQNFHSIEYAWNVTDFGVIVKTSDNLLSGTDDDITLWININNKKSIPIYLNKGKDYNANEVNSLEFFYHKVNSGVEVRDIKSFTLTKNGKRDDDWTIDFIALVDITSGDPLFVKRFAGPTVLEAKTSIEINDGFWKLVFYERN
ncbi:MAG: zinc dependent phospholipase C family protein [Clostridia bacterium]|nr:zinc dependent phospholipase C family protein [Clostridia bacterium]